MTILRPVLSVSALDKRSVAGRTRTADGISQDAADRFWDWAESRISAHTDRLCSKSVDEITSAVRRASSGDDRMQLILTQSAVTLDALSPFDKLEASMMRAGILPVRIQGSTNPSTASIEAAIIAAAVGVTGSSVRSDSCGGEVLLRGLDASLLEELPVRKDLVIIIEDGDSMDKDLLCKLVGVAFNLRRRLKRLSIVMESNLRDSLISEVIDDENLFIGLSVSTIPLLDARELCLRIHAVFFGLSAEVNLAGFPIALNEEDGDFLLKDLPLMSTSPLDLCMHVLEVVVHWFRKCPLSLVVSAPHSDFSSISKDIRPECLGSEYKGKTAISAFTSDLTRLMKSKQVLAIIGRVIENICRAVGCSIALPAVKELTALHASDRGKCVEKALMEIQARRKTEMEYMVASTVRSNNQLVNELASDFKISSDDPVLASIKNLNLELEPLGKRKFLQSKLIDDFFSLVDLWTRSVLPPVTDGELKAYTLLQTGTTTGLEKKFVDVDHFEPTLALLRADPREIEKNAKVKPELREMFATARMVYGGAERKKTIAKSIDLEVVVEKLRKDEIELAESLASLEFLGLLRQPGAVDLAYNSKVKLRRVYKDTPLFTTTPSDDEED